ncbi:MAG: hypothetical protein KatS3mg032_1966 [Cyclobacteriaceae bacterium]|nr:MAG: hypothetical protein KatS3mg032_1966 [Cyclobacteriaceae bacterium]
MFRAFLLVLLGLLGQSARAQAQLPDSLSRYNSRPHDPVYVDELNRLANDYLKINPYASRKIALHCADVAQQINYNKGYARALTVTGNSFWYEGIYDLAQNYYLLAARQYQTINDSIGLGQTYNNLGEVYKRMAEYERALEFLHRSLQLKRKDSATLAITLYNIGELYNLLGKYKEAEKYFHQSLAQALKDNQQRTVAYAYWGFAISALHRKNLNEAIDYFKRAEKLFGTLGETRLLIQMYQDVADVYIELKQFRQAENYLNLARQLWVSVKVPDLMIGNLYRRARLDSARGNYHQALKHLLRHIRLKDSVFNLAKAEQMTRLQLAYETENRERENQKLREANEQSRIQLRFQRLVILSVAAGLVLTTLLAWILLRQRRRILKVNKELSEKSAEIERQRRELEHQAQAVARLNEELKALNRSLESRIEERTRQLSVQNQKLTEYAYFNAHKLRAPVSSILGLINLLDYGVEKDSQAIIKHLRTCGEQLDAVTRQISKNLESGIIE